LEELLPLRDAAKLLPGGKVAASTLWRWCMNGVERDGRRIHLAHKRAGRYVYTTEADLLTFMTELGRRAS
jgi:hypothetical protein